MSDAKPIVFVVDDDVSVRESLKLLIESAGWKQISNAHASILVQSMVAVELLSPADDRAVARRHRYDQTRSVKAKLLDDGIDDTLVSVGATSRRNRRRPSTASAQPREFWRSRPA